jgi:hypothetical protein
MSLACPDYNTLLREPSKLNHADAILSISLSEKLSLLCEKGTAFPIPTLINAANLLGPKDFDNLLYNSIKCIETGAAKPKEINEQLFKDPKGALNLTFDLKNAKIDLDKMFEERIDYSNPFSRRCFTRNMDTAFKKKFDEALSVVSLSERVKALKSLSKPALKLPEKHLYCLPFDIY